MKCHQHLVAVFVTGVVAVQAQAAFYGGYHADITDFTNGSEVSTMGTFVEAVNLLNDNVGGIGVSSTINGVLFKGTQPGAFFEGAESFGDASFVYHGGDGAAGSFLWNSGGAYETLARSQIFNVDNPNSNSGDGFGVVNLTPGVQYMLQVFMLDDRFDISKTFPIQVQQTAWTGNFDQQDPNVTPAEIGYMPGITIIGNGVSPQANGEFATIRFVIDPGFNGVLVNTWDNGAFNGMQLRQLGIVGDYDNNQSVGPEDFQIWKNSFGSTTNLAADGNGDGVVNAADYTIWNDRIGATSNGSGGGGLGASSAPEPSTLLMLGLAIASAVIFRRHRLSNVI